MLRLHHSGTNSHKLAKDNLIILATLHPLRDDAFERTNSTQATCSSVMVLDLPISLLKFVMLLYFALKPEYSNAK